METRNGRPSQHRGSVVGITTAGVQASMKLYALAEKVATSSQMITSIGDDISSTRAILNQVRELIIPQTDAQRVLTSVFNSVALKDISDALQRCRSVFTEIGILLRCAFEQVGKRPALHSKIELSMLEKAKWPFLQPQFDDLRSNLRDAKGNLVLVIAVATLALAQRDGRQRPIHETERLELGSTIVQLEQARRIKPHEPTVHTVSEQPRGMPFSSGEDPLGSQSTHLMEASPPSSKQNTDPGLVSSIRKHGVPSISSGVSLVRSSLKLPSNGRLRDQNILNRSSPAAEVEAGTLPKSLPDVRSITCPGWDLLHEQNPSEQQFLQKSVASTPVSRSAGTTQLSKNRPQEKTASKNLTLTSSTSSNSEKTNHYQGWSTDYLQGLATGYGDSVTLTKMKLPEQSLQKLVKTYYEEGNDPHIGMLELTKEQQAIIKQSWLEHSQAELVYVHVQHNITISSVFGILSIETLKWIINIEESPQSPIGIAIGSMPHIPRPSTSIRRTSAMKTLFMKLVGGRQKSAGIYSSPPDNGETRAYPEIAGDSLRKPSLEGTHKLYRLSESTQNSILVPSINTVPITAEENHSESSLKLILPCEMMELPISAYKGRIIPPNLPHPEENGEDIVKELLVLWIVSEAISSSPTLT